MDAKTIRLHCQEPWFSYLRSGKKPVEGRKNSSKYAALKSGDLIEFFNGNESFIAEIIEIRRFSSIQAYLEGVGLDAALPHVPSLEKGLEIYHQWNSDADVAPIGFLGIFIKIRK